MTPSIPAIFTTDSITVTLRFVPYTVRSSDPYFDQVKDLLKNGGSEEDILYILNRAKMLAEIGDGVLVEYNGDVYHKGRIVHETLAKKFVEIKDAGMPTEPWELFVQNLYENPSKDSISELYQFLEASALPITPDGHFLAYKRVRENYTDCHSGTMDNSVGKIVEQDRETVDSDRTRTCSSGLHFCSYSYLRSFSGARLVVLKINPRDVVSIPIDYNNAKGRCCRYEVVADITDRNLPDETYFDSPVEDDPELKPDFNGWSYSDYSSAYVVDDPKSGEETVVYPNEIDFLSRNPDEVASYSKKVGVSQRKLIAMIQHFDEMPVMDEGVEEIPSVAETPKQTADETIASNGRKLSYYTKKGGPKTVQAIRKSVTALEEMGISNLKTTIPEIGLSDAKLNELPNKDLAKIALRLYGIEQYPELYKQRSSAVTESKEPEKKKTFFQRIFG